MAKLRPEKADEEDYLRRSLFVESEALSKTFLERF